MVLLFGDYCLLQRYQESHADRHGLVPDAAVGGEGAWLEEGGEGEQGHVTQMPGPARRIDRNPKTLLVMVSNCHSVMAPPWSYEEALSVFRG